MLVDHKCPRCSKSCIYTDSETGEMFCSSCGIVIEDRLEDSGPEWRALDNKQDRTRTGDRTSLAKHDRGLTTMIGSENKDSYGNPLSSTMNATLKRLRIWDNRNKYSEPHERNLQKALSELLKMKQKLGLSDAVVEKSAYIYRKALKRGLAKGRSVTSLMAAALYAACRESGTPRTLKEVSTAVNVSKKNLSHGYRLLLKEMDLKMPVVDYVSCVTKIANNAGLSEKTKRHAITILKKAKQEQIVAGKDPMGIAASALYLSTMKMQEHTSQRTIATAAGVSEVTLRNRRKGLETLY